MQAVVVTFALMFNNQCVRTLVTIFVPIVLWHAGGHCDIRTHLRQAVCADAGDHILERADHRQQLSCNGGWNPALHQVIALVSSKEGDTGLGMYLFSCVSLFPPHPPVQPLWGQGSTLWAREG